MLKRYESVTVEQASTNYSYSLLYYQLLIVRPYLPACLKRS